MLQLGERLGEYEIQRLLGRGGMGEVYQAYQPSLGRSVAVKVLPHWLTDDPMALERFRREAATAAQLDHPHIVPVHCLEQDGGRWFYTMKLVDGLSLKQVIEHFAPPLAAADRSTVPASDQADRQTPHSPGKNRAPVLQSAAGQPQEDWSRGDAAGDLEPTRLHHYAAEESEFEFALGGTAAAVCQEYRRDPFCFVARIGQQLASALAFAHDRGQIHRDVKPGNIMLDRHGAAYLIDFGLSRAMAGTVSEHGAGTPRYMSPEQMDLQTLDGRTDVYSLGVTLYEVVAGRPAFSHTDRTVLSRQIRAGAYMKLSAAVPDIPPRLAAAIERAMQSHRRKRFPSAAALAEELATCVAEMTTGKVNPVQPPAGRAKGPPKRRASIIMLCGLVGVLALASVFFPLPDKVPPPQGPNFGVPNLAGRAGNVVAPPPQAQVDPRALGEQPLEIIRNSLGMELVVLGPGRFWMGAAAGEAGANKSELPQHPVTFTRRFAISLHEVTQGQWVRLMGNNPSHFRPGGPGAEKVAGLDTSRFPVESITWNEAVEFCKRLSRLPEEKWAGRVYRLPTEAQWEYACRAGSQLPFHTGLDLDPQAENFFSLAPLMQAARVQPIDRTLPVGSLRPNAFGLYDMHGNVMEWCRDRYGQYVQGEAVDPNGPDVGQSRVVRGGAYAIKAVECRSAIRYPTLPDARSRLYGFRVVWELPEEE
jgi:formylglycine-generating enzyme required for sulfatase activity